MILPLQTSNNINETSKQKKEPASFLQKKDAPDIKGNDYGLYFLNNDHFYFLLNKDPTESTSIDDISNPDYIFLSKKPKKSTESTENILIPVVFPFDIKGVELTTFKEKISPVFQSLETMIIEHNFKSEISHIKSITYVQPGSILDGLEIQLEFFDTHPRSINIEFLGNHKSVELINKDLENLKKILSIRFETIEFPKILVSLNPIFPQSFNQQKKRNHVSEKKASKGTIAIKSIKQNI